MLFYTQEELIGDYFFTFGSREILAYIRLKTLYPSQNVTFLGGFALVQVWTYYCISGSRTAVKPASFQLHLLIL